MASVDYDVVIIGSGFGGSVAALGAASDRRRDRRQIQRSSAHCGYSFHRRSAHSLGRGPCRWYGGRRPGDKSKGEAFTREQGRCV
jgi:choline dehydrogenase-like flavoprotein